MGHRMKIIFSDFFSFFNSIHPREKKNDMENPDDQPKLPSDNMTSTHECQFPGYYTIPSYDESDLDFSPDEKSLVGKREK